MMRRFIVNETFTDEDTGTEYFQGAIYELDAKTKAKLDQWVAEDKVRDPDVSQDDDDDDEVEKAIEEAKAKHEADEDEDEDDDDDEKDEPA
jgi:hypothetical protein